MDRKVSWGKGIGNVNAKAAVMQQQKINVMSRLADAGLDSLK